MNKQKVVEIIWEAIGASDPCLGMEDDEILDIANCVVESLKDAGLLNFDKHTGAITAVVRQNEQTKEVCRCTNPQPYIDTGYNHKCRLCEKPF